MLFIIDKKLNQEIKDNLSKYGKIIELETKNITYPAISGHPDIFICGEKNKYIVAPNLPKHYIEFLKKENINIYSGNKCVGNKYPLTSLYNCVITNQFLIHNLKNTDDSLFNNFKDKEFINVKQGYTRCNLIYLNDNNFISSDLNICKVLKEKGMNVFYFPPENIILYGFKNGFFGGCCGIFDKTLFITGSIKYYPIKKELRDFLKINNIDLIELYDGPLIDGGSIIII